MSFDLTQAEADALMIMQKRTADGHAKMFPVPGGKLVLELESVDRTEDFLLDVTRSRIEFSRISYQNRGRSVIVLKRLDLNGPPHRNPDDKTVPCPHLHVYREGFGDKWAEAVPSGRFTDLNNLSQTLSEFMTECNVVEPPTVNPGLL